MNGSSVPESRVHRIADGMRRLAVGSSMGWLVVLAICYGTRAAPVALITILPPWFWAAPGVLLVPLSRRRGAWRNLLGPLVAWAIFLLVFCEEPRVVLTVLRAWPNPAWTHAVEGGRGIRVVSINTGGGDMDAVREALALHPDLLVISESPGDAPLRAELEKRGGMTLVHGAEVSIVARGEVRPIEVDKAARWLMNAAEVKLGELRVGIVGVHLPAPRFSFRIWSLADWREVASSQTSRTAAMTTVMSNVEKMDGAMMLVVAGDFNAPAGDAIYRLLPSGLQDSWPAAGIGLGNTMINDMPVVRIDQVWVDRRLRCDATVARKTVSSDHRAVVADVSMR